MLIRRTKKAKTFYVCYVTVGWTVSNCFNQFRLVWTVQNWFKSNSLVNGFNEIQILLKLTVSKAWTGLSIVWICFNLENVTEHVSLKRFKTNSNWTVWKQTERFHFLAWTYSSKKKKMFYLSWQNFVQNLSLMFADKPLTFAMKNLGSRSRKLGRVRSLVSIGYSTSSCERR